MALQMSPVDAHHQDQPHCHYQPTKLQIESAGLNGLVELSQCQLLDCSPIEQVPLSTVSHSKFVLKCYDFKASFSSVGNKSCAAKSERNRTKGVCSGRGFSCNGTNGLSVQ